MITQGYVIISGVAQWLELRIIIPSVAGSTPVSRAKQPLCLAMRLISRPLKSVSVMREGIKAKIIARQKEEWMKALSRALFSGNPESRDLFYTVTDTSLPATMRVAF